MLDVGPLYHIIVSLNSDCVIEMEFWNAEGNFSLFIVLMGMISLNKNMMINLEVIKDMMDIDLACIDINNIWVNFEDDIVVV